MFKFFNFFFYFFVIFFQIKQSKLSKSFFLIYQMNSSSFSSSSSSFSSSSSLHLSFGVSENSAFTIRLLFQPPQSFLVESKGSKDSNNLPKRVLKKVTKNLSHYSIAPVNPFKEPSTPVLYITPEKMTEIFKSENPSTDCPICKREFTIKKSLFVISLIAKKSFLI